MSTEGSGATQRVVVGRIGPAHGIQGDVYVQPLTDVPEIRFADEQVLHAGPPVSGDLTVEYSKEHSGRLLVRFRGISGRGAAEALRNAELEADIDPLESPLDDEEYFDRQLIGLAAIDSAGAAIGVVTDVVHLPAQDLLAIELDSGGERLVPFVRQIVPEVDLERGCVVVDAPVGLLADPDDADDAEPDHAEELRS